MSTPNVKSAPPAPEAPPPVFKTLAEGLNVTESPEFRRAVADGVKEALPALRDEIMASLGGAAKGPAAGDLGFAESLAMAISQLTNQGTGRKLPVAPEVLKARTEARESMMELILAARAEGLTPSYKLRAKVYVDDQLVEPKWVDPSTKSQRDTEIDWPGVPNDAMIPVNEIATKIFEQFQRSNSNRPKEALDAPKEASTLWIHHGGLVVRGGAVAPPPVGADNTPASETGLRVKHRGAPGTYAETHIVGTIAPPAQKVA